MNLLLKTKASSHAGLKAVGTNPKYETYLSLIYIILWRLNCSHTLQLHIKGWITSMRSKRKPAKQVVSVSLLTDENKDLSLVS